MIACEPCRLITECLQFPLVFYNLGAGKTYSNPLLGFLITCPDGNVVTRYVAAGTITYTFPFPAGYTGEYPPLVLACKVGGNIVRNLPTGSTQAQIDAIIGEMILTCAKAIAQSEADCARAPATFSNGVVYFDHPCISGTLTFSGSLPSWITIDTINSRLVGAAGTFQSNTLESANQIAQAALDGWANQQLTMGNLSCVSGPSCIALIASVPSVVADFSFPQLALTATNDPTVQRLMIADLFTPQLVFVDTSNNTVVGTVALAGGGLSCFATSTQRFYTATGGSNISVLSKDGAVITTIVAPDSVIAMGYSSAQNLVYAPIFPTPNTHIISIDPTTNTVVGNTDLSVNYSLPTNFYVLNNNCIFDAAPSLFFYSLPGVTLAGTLNIGASNGLSGACFATNVGKYLFGLLNPITFNGEVWQVDPVTFAVDKVYALPDTASTVSVDYNPATGTVIAKQSSGSINVIDPIGQTIVCSFMASPGVGVNAAIDQATGKVYTMDFPATLLVYH